MPRPQIHECTTHQITLCHEAKKYVQYRKAGMLADKIKQGNKTCQTVNYSEAINSLLIELSELKGENQIGKKPTVEEVLKDTKFLPCKDC